MLKRKGKNTKAEIRNHALLLFAEKGFKSVTMNDICVSTGLSRGGLYRYYGSTSEIFAEILTKIVQGIGDNLAEALRSGKSPTQSLDMLLNNWSKSISDVETSVVFATIEFCHLKGSEALEKAYSRAMEIWTSFINYGIAQGEFNRIDPRAAAATIMFAYEGARAASALMTISENTGKGLANCIRTMLVKPQQVQQMAYAV